MEDSHYHDDLLKIDFLKSLKEKFKESGNYLLTQNEIVWIQKAVDFEESVLMAPYLDVQLLEKTQSLHQKKAELAKTQKQLEEEQDNFAQMKKELEQKEKNLTSLMEANIPNPFQIPQSSKRKISS